MTFGRVLNSKGLTIFTRQLATLVKAGMPILRSIEVLARQEKRAGFKIVLEEIADTIRSGGNFSEGLAAHPKLFDRLYVNMVRAGEAGGVLSTVLERLSVFNEKSERIKGKVKSAMIYPAIISSVAVAIVSVLMVVVVPQFQAIFTGMLKGQPLPALTQLLLSVSFFMRDNFLLTAAAVAGIYFGFGLFKRTKPGARVIDWLLIHAPVIGDLMLKATIARFTRTFGTLLDHHAGHERQRACRQRPESRSRPGERGRQRRQALGGDSDFPRHGHEHDRGRRRDGLAARHAHAYRRQLRRRGG
jgi:type IV pilus assembly protein PilC